MISVKIARRDGVGHYSVPPASVEEQRVTTDQEVQRELAELRKDRAALRGRVRELRRAVAEAGEHLAVVNRMLNRLPAIDPREIERASRYCRALSAPTVGDAVCGVEHNEDGSEVER